MDEVISLADKGKFSKFADKVKGKLEDKLRNHKTIVKNAKKLKDYEEVKDQFAKIDKVLNKEIKKTEEPKATPDGEEPKGNDEDNPTS